MSDKVEFSITGVDELLGKLDSISDDLKYKGGRAALRRAAMLIVKNAKEKASKIDDPITGRVIADNIAARWSGKLFRRTGNLGFRVGVLTGTTRGLEKGNPDSGKGGKTPHAMLVELGTSKAKAQPYLRPAAENHIGEIINTFATQYEKAIDRAIRRAKKKAAK